MKILVIGTAGIQVTIPIDKFPIEYKSIHFMDDLVATDVAGVGFSAINILSKLGVETTFLTGIGNDAYADVILDRINKVGSNVIYEVKDKESLISVVLYDESGKRMILREGRMDYQYRMNPEIYSDLGSFDVALFTMTNFSKDLLPIIKEKNIPIVIDMQTVDNLKNDYGKPFMEHADIIFFSNDHFDGDLEHFVVDLHLRHQFDVIGVGLGEEGCLIYSNNQFHHINAPVVDVVNTVGAGDTLFTTFIYYYYKLKDAKKASELAVVHASEKIKYKTASQGFLTEEELMEEYDKYKKVNN